VRIIGYGNRDRQDDAAGLLAARRLRQLGVDALTHTGEAASLLELWSGADEVIVIDAVVTGAEPGTIHVWEGSPPRVPRQAQLSTHGPGLAEAIELAAVLGRLPERLTVYGIEGKHFDAGGVTSPEVVRAAETVATSIAADLALVR
jgi:hydrogenase maturation protease